MDKKIRNVIGPACVRLREAQGLTQEQMCARCTVAGLILSRGSYAKIESQERQVTDFEIMQLAKIFKVELLDLFPQQIPAWAKHRQSAHRED